MLSALRAQSKLGASNVYCWSSFWALEFLKVRSWIANNRRAPATLTRQSVDLAEAVLRCCVQFVVASNEHLCSAVTDLKGDMAASRLNTFGPEVPHSIVPTAEPTDRSSD
ncbi:hypothetical protein EVAR_47898_1 [Eumeta japonica]|uniref:Uncharacterized protein n=1 Tax=Eumeta variegata TaxID=151549 RepID=A0A4C1YAN1_EUMVA|nr:hypothetical protein EVAR_47898_1 [Eumeta japonica]